MESLLILIVVLIIVGVALHFLPMDPRFKNAIFVIIVLVLLIIVLRALLGGL